MVFFHWIDRTSGDGIESHDGKQSLSFFLVFKEIWPVIDQLGIEPLAFGSPLADDGSPKSQFFRAVLDSDLGHSLKVSYPFRFLLGPAIRTDQEKRLALPQAQQREDTLLTRPPVHIMQEKQPDTREIAPHNSLVCTEFRDNILIERIHRRRLGAWNGLSRPLSQGYVNVS